MGFAHVSVMPEEVIRYLAPQPGGIYVDGTLGGGGHAGQLLEMCGPNGVVIGFDRDEDAIKAASARLYKFGNRFHAVHRNFSEMEEALHALRINSVDGVLLDLGVSSYQLDDAQRGFTFQKDAPLDMRMDTSSGDTAEDLINKLSEGELARIIREFGEERWAARIAKRMVEARKVAPLKTTLQLVDVIKGSIPRAKWEERLHPATRTFQALRIAVNGELQSLEKGLHSAIKFLHREGRIVVISFHSLEDRIVKNTFRDFAKPCTCLKSAPICVCGKMPEVRVLTGKPVVPRQDEISANPRSRSAKLRAAEKL